MSKMGAIRHGSPQSAIAHPSWRGAVGVYRFWRDLGYATGALVSGVAADATQEFSLTTNVCLQNE
jgi:hypothetical protein